MVDFALLGHLDLFYSALLIFTKLAIIMASNMLSKVSCFLVVGE